MFDSGPQSTVVKVELAVALGHLCDSEGRIQCSLEQWQRVNALVKHHLSGMKGVDAKKTVLCFSRSETIIQVSSVRPRGRAPEAHRAALHEQLQSEHALQSSAARDPFAAIRAVADDASALRQVMRKVEGAKKIAAQNRGSPVACTTTVPGFPPLKRAGEGASIDELRSALREGRNIERSRSKVLLLTVTRVEDSGRFWALEKKSRVERAYQLPKQTSVQVGDRILAKVRAHMDRQVERYQLVLEFTTQ